MGNPLSNPAAPTNPPGPTTGVTRKVGGSRKLPSTAIDPTGTTRGRAVTSTPDGTQGGAPGILREAQDRARGTVHGQPKSGYNAGDVTSPIPNCGH
jgi:hypothetical protein